MRLRMLDPDRKIWQGAPPHVDFILNANIFPRILVEALIRRGAPDDSRAASHLQYEVGLCHECNRVAPAYLCGATLLCGPEAGGSSLEERYGWYMNKQAYEWGLDPYVSCRHILWDVCPQELRGLMRYDPVSYQAWARELDPVHRSQEQEEIVRQYQAQQRSVYRVIENEVRQKFGHAKIGEGWASETILYYLVRALYPEVTVRRHFRPGFLEGLELDVFMEEPRVGVEYQGVQHFEPVEHWGGPDGLRKRRANDEKKRRICLSLGIPLVYFRFDEPLTQQSVAAKLEPHIRRGARRGGSRDARARSSGDTMPNPSASPGPC